MKLIKHMFVLLIVTILLTGCGVKNSQLARTQPWMDESKIWTPICEPTPDQVRCFLDDELPCEIDDKNQLCSKLSNNQPMESDNSQSGSIEPDMSKLDKADVTKKDETISVSFPNRIFFSTASAELSSDAEGTLDELAQLLNRYPDASVQVNGHTDARPIDTENYSNNQDLSEARAKAVVDYLVNQAGLDASRFVARGFGSSRPVTSDDDQRELNRRVEFVIEPSE